MFDEGHFTDDSLFYLKYKLANGDLSKITIIENMDIDYCYQWLYLTRVKELNEMRMRIAEMERMKG